MAVVIWSDKAKQDLRGIHAFHYVNTSPEFAARLLTDLVDAADVLEQMPQIAPRDLEFQDLGEIRGLLVRQKGKKPQYKLVYLIEGDICYILSVWNLSRNPEEKFTATIQGLSK